MSVGGSFQLSWSGSGIPSTYNANSVGFPIGQVTVYNNTPAQLALYPSLPSVRPSGLFPWGGIIVPAFYPITVPIPLWTGFAFATDGTSPFILSSLTIFIQGAPSTSPPPLSPFGPSGWGAGSDPSSLQRINPGDPILAWQNRQYYLALTGSLPVSILANSIVFDGNGGIWSIALDPSGDLQIENINTSALTVVNRLTDAWTFPKRVTASLTGSSAKSLQNLVPITVPSLFSHSGSGSATGTFTDTDIPTDATGAFIKADFVSDTAGDLANILQASSGSSAITIPCNTANVRAYGSNYVAQVTPGQTINWSVIGIGNWTLRINATTGYTQPS